MNFTVKKTDLPGRAGVYRFWLLYFFGSIGVVGFAFAYCVTIPCCILGRFYRPLWIFGGKALRRGVDTLLKAQPWLRLDADLKFPPRDEAGNANYLTISNHRSLLDMYILLARIAGIRSVARSSLFKVPFLGVVMVATGHFSVRRGDSVSYWRAMKDAVKSARRGDPVHIFPEMTRCDLGFQGVQEFHLAPFRVAREAGLPLVPIVFCGSDEAWPKGKWGLTYRRLVVVRTLPPVDPLEFESAEALRDAVRSRIEAGYFEMERERATRLILEEELSSMPAWQNQEPVRS